MKYLVFIFALTMALVFAYSHSIMLGVALTVIVGLYAINDCFYS